MKGKFFSAVLNIHPHKSNEQNRQIFVFFRTKYCFTCTDLFRKNLIKINAEQGLQLKIIIFQAKFCSMRNTVTFLRSPGML